MYNYLVNLTFVANPEDYESGTDYETIVVSSENKLTKVKITDAFEQAISEGNKSPEAEKELSEFETKLEQLKKNKNSLKEEIEALEDEIAYFDIYDISYEDAPFRVNGCWIGTLLECFDSIKDTTGMWTSEKPSEDNPIVINDYFDIEVSDG